MPFLKAALSFAARGWCVTPLNERDKKPRLSKWQESATTDEDLIRQWWTAWPSSNIGVQLGPKSGIIDIECDSPEAEAELAPLLDGTIVPTFSGARGLHRLFLWEEGLPDKAVMHTGSIEVRLGNGGKGAQSVFPPSIHPTGAEYQWQADGKPPAIPARLLQRIKEEIKVPSAPIGLPAVASTDLADRIRKYLDTIPPAISGSEGSKPTFRAACVLVLGYNLKPDEAYPFLAEWSETCLPPWSEKELRHKLSDADKQPGRRGWLLDERDAGPFPQIDALVDNLTAGAVVPAMVFGCDHPDDVPEDPHELPVDPATIPGTIGEIVRHNLKTALYPQPELALGAAIALMATITGRKATDSQGTRTNVYVLGLAPSGSGKEHARKVNKEILLRAGAAKMLGPERIGSSAGLARSVCDQPAILFQLDEISRLLETTKSSKSAHLWNVPSVLLQLFGSSSCLWIGDAYAKKEQTPVINQPHACIYGTSVPGPFWAAMTHENVTEGLLGRFLPFESGYTDMQPVDVEEVPQGILDRIRWWTELNPSGNLGSENPQPITLVHSAEARDRFKGHAADITRRRKKEDHARAAMWSRTIGNTAKLALIFACSEGAGSIDLSHVNAAVRISNWATRRMLRMVFEYVAANDRERELKKILRLVATPMTKNQLTRKTQNLKERDRAELVRELIETGLVEIAEEKTHGRIRNIIRQKHNLDER